MRKYYSFTDETLIYNGLVYEKGFSVASELMVYYYTSLWHLNDTNFDIECEKLIERKAKQKVFVTGERTTSGKNLHSYIGKLAQATLTELEAISSRTVSCSFNKTKDYSQMLQPDNYSIWTIAACLFTEAVNALKKKIS